MPNKHLSDNDPLKGKKSGKWSKYGDSVSGLVKEKIDRIWYCQKCGEKMPESLKPWLFEMSEGEYLRLCSLCIRKCES